MRKFLLILALVATPAYADEDPIVAKARAELAEMQAKNRANEAIVIANNEMFLKKNQEELDKLAKQGVVSNRTPTYTRSLYWYRDVYNLKFPRNR